MTARNMLGAIFLTVTVAILTGCGTAERNQVADAEITSTLPPTLTPSSLPSNLQSALPSTTVDTSPPSGDRRTDALAELSRLPIKGRAPKTGYDRALFGDAWTDDVTVEGGRNGCDTRNDILRRDLVDIVFKPGSNDCAIVSGILNDPYSGATIAFERGADTSADVQIDHIVALSDSWQKGAQNWDEVTRRNFANDPLNLQATVGNLNQQKGDGDAATWLPPDKSYRCSYVARIVKVKSVYAIWVTQAERDAIVQVLSSCGASDFDMPSEETSSETTPVETEPFTPITQPEPLPESPLAPSLPLETPLPPVDVSAAYYPNCRAAKAAGAAPLYAGQPGYRTGLDGDGDGVACEG